MSDTPRLVILRHDLQNKEDLLNWDDVVDHFLSAVLDHHPFTLAVNDIQKVEMVSCRPELSGFSKRVRERLWELDVAYAADYN